MAKNACHHLLSLGGAPRNHTLAWISEELIVYAGLSDICIVRKVRLFLSYFDLLATLLL